MAPICWAWATWALLYESLLVWLNFPSSAAGFSLSKNVSGADSLLAVQQPPPPLQRTGDGRATWISAQSVERHAHASTVQGSSAFNKVRNVAGEANAKQEAPAEKAVPPKSTTDAPVPAAAAPAAQGKAPPDSLPPSKEVRPVRRFGAAPFAAAVAAEAESAAAAAVAAATAAAKGKSVALLAAPRGFCEGVSRAVGAVEEALRVFGKPVYVKHQIVHNEFVCKQLEARGAVFVEDIEEVPPNSVVVFSAHGIPPEVREAAQARGLLAVDATCPLVQKVHVYVQQKAKEGYQIVIIGHKDHVEVQGVKGEAPGSVQVVESEADVALLSFPPNTKLFYVTQTTLSVLDCMRIEQALRKKYPKIETIPSGSVCYATTNRQAALGALSARAQLALVVGSSSSSNAKRLVEVAKSRGIPAYLVSSPDTIDPHWLKGVQKVVVSASASTPEALTEKVMKRLSELGVTVQSEALAVNETKPTWKLPKNLRDAAKLIDERKPQNSR